MTPSIVQRDRKQRLDRVDLEAAGGQLGHGGERPGGRPVRLALGAAFLARVDQRHHLDVGIVEIGAHVEVVDTAEADECGAYRPLVRCEIRHL